MLRYTRSMVNIGDAMPDSVLVGDSGPIKLRDKVGKALVVYFYPKDETAGCTTHASGVCRSRFDSQVRVGKHVDDALALVKRLGA